MRILAIRGKNLASLAEPFEILLYDGPLQQAGLFAITGPTGAGKSTILDALCLALYDKMPRLPDGHGFAVGHQDEDDNLRVTSNDVRSILRRGAGHAYAEVDFIGKDKQYYRTRWEVSKARGKANGRLQAQDISLSRLADGQRIGQGKKNTLETISELIDLNFDQFRRSVLLAQGDFAAFLKAKKDERSSLLERITGTDIYSELSIAAFERVRAEKEALNRIAGLMQNQVPLDDEARLNLEQQRDHASGQLTELDRQIGANQKIIDWYSQLKHYRQAEQQASEAHADRQQRWAETEAERLLSQKVEAVQPLRPLLSHYKMACDDYQEAEKTLKTFGGLQTAAETAGQQAKIQLAARVEQLQAAQLQQQQALPLLKAARDLDTRLEVMQNAVNALTAEEQRLHQALEAAQGRHQALLKQQAEHSATQAQFTRWLEQQAALKPIAAQWRRWESELERYQLLKGQQTAAALQAEQLTHTVNHEESVLAGLKASIAENHRLQEQQQIRLEQLKEQGGQQSLADLYQEKDALEHSINAMNHALSLANQAQQLQLLRIQDADKLAATEQLMDTAMLQLQTLTGQQFINDIALAEAKKALDLIQAASHKNAGQFRRLLTDDRPCPVCGALEHPWQGRDSDDGGNEAIIGVFAEQAAAQLGRVNELQGLKEAFIKNSAELNKTIADSREVQRAYAASLPQAQIKLDGLGDDWRGLVLPDKPDFTLADARLLPLLGTRNEQLLSAWALIKNREKAALALQQQITAAQDLFDASSLKTEKLANEYAELDKRLAKHKADLSHIGANIKLQQQQLQLIVDLLSAPFAQLDNWQLYLQDSLVELRAQVQKFEHTEQALADAAAILVGINQHEKLAAQTLAQCLQQYKDQQAENLRKRSEKQVLAAERDALLPRAGTEGRLTADSYELRIDQHVVAARTAHQQAADAVTQTEQELAGLQLRQQHWQLESARRRVNLEQALAALNKGLEKHALNLEQLSELLKYDEVWLQEQKTGMLALERALQESAALLAVKTDDCRRHENHAVEISEDAAQQTAVELQQHKQILSSQKEEQVLLLREDDKKILAGRHLKVELETQQERWRQWEGLNDVIGSSNGAKFRVFAQSLTLEALLAHSNRHLEDFAQRYVLQRVPGSALELQIIDRDMADDVRSVHSLSGGESFLVSLALALGLASLSSNRTQVESLFIDEGFGSLDPETLDIAIASLDTLQALGRKVGVISHVPILVERIGAKVVVEKQGGGRSSVVIVGRY